LSYARVGRNVVEWITMVRNGMEWQLARNKTKWEKDRIIDIRKKWKGIEKSEKE